MDKRQIAGWEISRLAADNGVLALVGATVNRALSDLWGNDEILALDALDFFLSNNCAAFIERSAGIAEVDGDKFFKAVIFWKREKGLMANLPGVASGKERINGTTDVYYSTLAEGIDDLGTETGQGI